MSAKPSLIAFGRISKILEDNPSKADLEIVSTETGCKVLSVCNLLADC